MLWTVRTYIIYMLLLSRNHTATKDEHANKSSLLTEQLTDLHMLHEQRLLKQQFPHLNGLQPKVFQMVRKKIIHQCQTDFRLSMCMCVCLSVTIVHGLLFD